MEDEERLSCKMTKNIFDLLWMNIGPMGMTEKQANWMEFYLSNLLFNLCALAFVCPF